MSSFQTSIGTRSSTMIETSCGYLLQELQMIWNEVGEDKLDREKVLVDLEQECVEVYRRKVNAANSSRARLHQELAEAEAEFTHLLLSLGERSLPSRPEKMAGTLKEQLGSIAPALKEMQHKKQERMSQFLSVQGQICKISAEIAGQVNGSSATFSSSGLGVNESDLSLKKLEEYQIELQRLHDEKNERLHRAEKYIDAVHKLSTILGLDSTAIISEAHPSLNDLCSVSKNISNGVLARLNSAVVSLEDEKKRRLEKLHELGKALTNLWNLMDTRVEDRRLFSHVVRLLTVSSAEVSDPGSLTQSILVQAEAEVKRLDQLKASKMKELFLKKQKELEEVCNRSHMEIPSRTDMDMIFNLIRLGEIDHADLLVSMDEQISRAKEEAFSRKVIMEKAEKWMLACDEERWLEDYSRDENRYSVSRGAHKNLRRAERARLAVNKIPALMDSLIEKTRIWEEERNKVFLYDEVPLLAMLEEYNAFRQQKEDEKHRQREKKKAHNVVAAVQQEAAFGTRPGTSSRRLSDRASSLASIGFINSPPRGSMVPKKPMQGHIKTLFRPRIFSGFRDETASVVSTFSGPISP